MDSDITLNIHTFPFCATGAELDVVSVGTVLTAQYKLIAASRTVMYLASILWRSSTVLYATLLVDRQTVLKI